MTSYARRVAERLFLRLRNPASVPPAADSVKVVYPERFCPGKAVIAVIVPLRKIKLGTGLSYIMAMREYRYSPAIIESSAGPSLAIFIPCPQLRAENPVEILREARTKAEWAKRVFGLPFMLSPGGGVVSLLNRLGALSPV